MRKRDYETIAKTIKYNVFNTMVYDDKRKLVNCVAVPVKSLIEVLSDLFADDDYNFNAEKFLKACSR